MIVTPLFVQKALISLRRPFERRMFITSAYLSVGDASEDLIDTLKANLDGCVGMAANMIGYNKRIIVFVDDNNKIDYMMNPTIIKKEDSYEIEESCLSLKISHKALRYKNIKVEYYNDKFQKRLIILLFNRID